MTSAMDGIDMLVRAYARGDVDDEAMQSWLAAVYDRGLSADDTFTLTMAMASSGETLDWSDLPGPVVDKHSTGGVGDAVTLLAVPLAAACGATVAKLSGRALGHTGGTIDKLEAVPGLRTDLSIAEFRSIVRRVGCAIAAATENLAPADKRLYALRDRMGLVASIPLIAASVMSKKIAAGAGVIVLDVKVGRGAFIQSLDDARTLAKTMRAIGERAGRIVTTLITNMDEPLADCIGDALEMDEALSIMEGRAASPRLQEVAALVAAAMLRGAGHGADDAERALTDGRALAKIREMIAAQGGRLEAFDRSWPPGVDVRARAAGRIERIDARPLGEAVAEAKRGAPAVEASRFGVRLRCRAGAAVRAGDPLLTYWLPRHDRRLDDAFTIASNAGKRT